MKHRSKGGRLWRWGEIVAECRALPGAWAVRLPNEPRRLLRTIRERSAPELRLDDGKLEAVIRNQYRDEMGRLRGDIYIRFTPR